MSEPSLSGGLFPFELPLVFTMLEMCHASGELEVRGSGGDGVVYFKRGAVVGARSGSMKGEPAALTTLGIRDGRFEFRCGEDVEDQGIERSNQGLCLEAMRLLDESQSSVLHYERLDSSLPVGIDAVAVAVLAVLDHPSTLEEIKAASGLSGLAALYYLEKLERCGAVGHLEPGSRSGSIEPDSSQQAVVRVLVVDDSKLMQKVLTRLYESDPGVVVVGVAENGEQALQKLHELKPDLVSLDLYMPVMDGVTALKRIMLSQPTPTMIVTSANPDDLDRAFESILRFGAIDFVTKPAKHRGEMGSQTKNILSRLRKAARVNLRGLRMVQPPPRASRQRAYRGECRGLVVAAAGTGGCLSFMQMLTGLPTDFPLAVVGVLDFPEGFLRAFVSYLAKISALDVQLATDGAALFGGVCYMASAGSRVRVERGSRGPVLKVADSGSGPEELLMDAARVFGHRASGLALSGEGSRLLAGLAAIRASGGVTMAQLPETCVDPEQPRLAIEAGLVDRVVLLPRLFSELSQQFMSRLRRDHAGDGAPVELAELTERESSWPRMSA